MAKKCSFGALDGLNGKRRTRRFICAKFRLDRVQRCQDMMGFVFRCRVRWEYCRGTPLTGSQGPHRDIEEGSEDYAGCLGLFVEVMVTEIP